MGISLYHKENDQFVTGSIITTHDGKSGDVHAVQLFLRNDDVNLWFSNIQVTPVDSTATASLDETDYDSTGWGVRLIAGDNEPSASHWSSTNWGIAISMPNIGASGSADISTYYSFWYQITCPPNENAETKQNIVFRVTYTENAA
jgi:hypothetical protein